MLGYLLAYPINVFGKIQRILNEVYASFLTIGEPKNPVSTELGLLKIFQAFRRPKIENSFKFC